MYTRRYYIKSAHNGVFVIADRESKETVIVNGRNAATKRLNELNKQNTTPTSTLEPQTIAFQCAMDNIYFAQMRTAGQIKSDFATRKVYEEDDRISYVVDLEHRMELALGAKRLGYQLNS